MQTIGAERMDILRELPVGEVNITFAFAKHNKEVYLNIDGNSEKIQQFKIPFSQFQKVVTAWLDGESD